MKKLRKKIVALFLTAAMVVSLAPAAFAGTFSDVKADASYAGAVERLAGLGIIAGMGDGTFQPDGTFTRAQAAKIAVMLRGVKNAGTGATEFSDVPATHWASGWINLASGLGIIKGKGNGKFDPEGKVTHAEWLTMVLRVLGYGPQIDKMAWPAGALAKAALLGLDNGVNVVANLPASRAEVAVMSDNALTAEIVDCGFDANGNVTNCAPKAGTSIAANYLKAKSTETTLLKSPELFGETKVTVADDIYGLAAGTKSADLVAGTKTDGLLGHKVKVWVNADGKVYFVEDLSTNVQTLKVKSGKVQLDGKDITNDNVAAPVKVFKNRQAQNDVKGSNLAADLNAVVASADNGEITAVLDSNGKIAAVNFVQSDATRIVDSVSTAFENIATKTIAGGNDSLSVKDKTVIWSGAAGKLADLQKGDVIEYYSATVGGKIYVSIVVTRNTKTGDFTRVDAAGNKVTVGGTQYDEEANFSADANLLGKAVKITLNRFGKVVAMESTTAEAAKTIAALYGDPWSNVADSTSSPDKVVKVRVIKSDGTEAIYEVAKDATVDANNDGTNDITAFDPTAANSALTKLKGTGKVGDKSVIEYTTDSNGKINAITVLHDGTVTWTSTATTNKDNNTITGGGLGAAIIAVTTGTVIFDVIGTKPAVVTRDRLMGESDNTTTSQVVRTKAGESLAKAIAIRGGLSATAADTFGLVMGRYQTSGPKYYLSINVKGTTTDYEVDKTTVHDVYGADAVVKFNPTDTKGANAVTGLSARTVTTGYEWRVQEIDGTNKVVYIDEYNTTTGAENATDKRVGLLVSDKTQVFKLNGDADATYGSFADLAVGAKVLVYDETGDGVLEVIVIDN